MLSPSTNGWKLVSLTALIVAIGVGVAIYFVPALRSVSVSIFAGAGVLAVITGKDLEFAV